MGPCWPRPASLPPHAAPAPAPAPARPHPRTQVDAEGRKFGKSVGGAVWLSAERLSPYKFYQYLFAVSDADIIKFLKMLTFLPLDQISQVEASMKVCFTGARGVCVVCACVTHR